MSWYIERLVIESDHIKNTEELDSDLFLDLLTLESKINYLYKNNYVSELEMDVLSHMIKGYSISATAKDLKLSRSTTSMIFTNICTRIAFYLGEHFTNDGYLDYMQEKYNLSYDKIIKAKKFMEGKYRHSFSRSSK